MRAIITYQPSLRPALPTVYGPHDYREYRRMFEHIDELLSSSGLVERFIELSVQEAYERSGSVNPALLEHSERALRCMIAQMISGDSYRKFTQRLADSQVLQWFCRVGDVEQVTVPAKSTLQRYFKQVSHEPLNTLIYDFLRACNVAVDETKEHPLGLEESLDFDAVYVDATCLKANIHFPVDWVLLVDAVRTLMKATLIIREHGLKHRMRRPEAFISEMNALDIKMSCSYRQVGSKKERKKTLRLMKKLVNKVASHARKHRDLLEAHQDEMEMPAGKIEQILVRIDNVLEQLPAAKRQAHERIIGGRQINNQEKLLSLYESDVNVIVRKKAGHKVEFGNLLTLAEQKDGLLVGWHLHQELTSDQNFIPTLLDTVHEGLGHKIKRLFTDRGYNSPTNTDYLQEQTIYNGICPQDPEQLTARKHSSVFIHGQKRRAATQGRISIFKNVFTSNPMHAKGFENRRQRVSWAVLTHNLWLIARKLREQELQKLHQAA